MLVYVSSTSPTITVISLSQYMCQQGCSIFGGTAQKLWVLHCLDSFRPFLSVANLGMLSSIAVSRFAYLGFQSKEIVIDMLPHTGWYWSLS